MAGTITVSEAKPDDLDMVAELFDAYRMFYRQPTDLAAARAFLQERFRRRDAIIFIAYRDGVPAGFTQLYPSLSSVSMAPIWILNDLFVNAAARGHGVGRRLMD